MSKEDIQALKAAHVALCKCDDARIAFSSDTPLRFYRLAVGLTPRLLDELAALRTRAKEAEDALVEASNLAGEMEERALAAEAERDAMRAVVEAARALNERLARDGYGSWSNDDGLVLDEREEFLELELQLSTLQEEK